MRDELEKLNLEVESAEARLKELKRRVLMLKSPESKNEESLASIKKESIVNYKAQLKEKDKRIQKTEEFFNVGRWSFNFGNSSLEWSDETYKIFEFPDDFTGTLLEYYYTCADESSKSRLDEYSKKLRTTKEDFVINQTIITPQGLKNCFLFLPPYF